MKLNQVLQEFEYFNKLDEANIKGVKNLIKKHNKFSILYHMDLDGVFSAISLKHILKNEYRLKLKDAQVVQYGNIAYNVKKTWDEDTLVCMVDFSQGKPFVNVWTDHHSGQSGIKPGTSTSFIDAPANAYHISAEMSKRLLTPMEDLEIISTVDSADFYKHGLEPADIMRAAFGLDKSVSIKDNKWRMGLVVNKLLLSYKNKPDFLNKLVVKSNPSLISLYNVIRRLAKEEGYRPPEEIEQHQQNYIQQQKENIVNISSASEVKNLENGQSAMLGDAVVQYGGGSMMPKRGLQFDRYVVFNNHPDAKFLVMGWPLGMIQISANPFKEKNINVNFKEVADNVLDDYKSNWQNNMVSLSYIKKKYEEDITKKNLENAVGYTFDDLISQFTRDQIQGLDIEKEGSWKNIVSDITNKKWKDLSKKQKNILEKVKISVWDIIENSTGGHSTGIWNISSLNFLGKGYVDTMKKIMADIVRELNKR